MKKYFVIMLILLKELFDLDLPSHFFVFKQSSSIDQSTYQTNASQN